MALKPSEKRTALAGMNLALENARSLLKDASILLRHRRGNSALALAVAAMEEAGQVLYLCMVPHPHLCLDLFARHPDRLQIIATPDWQVIFRLRHHKLPGPTDSARVKQRRAAAALARYLGRGRRHGAGYSTPALLDLRGRCLRAEPGKAGNGTLGANGLPYKVASATATIASLAIDDLARLRDVYRRGMVARLAEQLVQALHSRPERRALLRALRIPPPMRPRLLPATGTA